MARKIEARIDLAALRHNLDCVRRLAPQSRVLAVVKADAYGHGARLVLDALAGADALAVAHIDEALELRAHTRQPIVVLEGFLDEAEWRQCLAGDITPVLHQGEQLALLERLPPPPGAGLWIKVDTGMHRLGFSPTELPRVLSRVRAATPAAAPVLMTHLARSEEIAHELTARQVARLDAANAGHALPLSIANSGAIVHHPHTHRDWVRPGLMLYGYVPGEVPRAEDRAQDALPRDIDAVGARLARDDHQPATGLLPLRPVMTLRARVIAVREVEAGEEIGYNGRWRAPRATRIATASAGYADGYPTQLRDGTPVLVDGRCAALAGRPSMDMITVDVGGIGEVRIGAEVVLWGDGLPATEIATHADTLVYQLLTGVSKRVTRVASGD
jgi:alanine racemase